MCREHRLLGALLLAASAIFLVLASACGGETTGDNDDSAAGMSQGAPGGLAASGSAPAKDAANGDQAQPPGAAESGDPAALTLDRKIIFTAGITLSVDDVQRSFGEASRIATAVGGFVEKSSFANTGADEQRGATLTLRVPAAKYQDTLTSLRSVQGAAVKSETSKSSEVTEQYTDLQSRLRNLERTEQQYLALLEQAKTIPDILTVQDRLDGVRLQIEQIQGRLKVLDDQTELATIDVTLAAAVPGKVDDGKGGPKGVQEAFSDAWAWFTEASKYVMAGVAVLAAAAIFLALPAAIAAAIAVVVSRRRSAGAV